MSEMTPLRENFEKWFSAADADRIVEAAEGHAAEFEIGSNRGADHFGGCFLLAVGFQCVDRYRDAHGIEASEERLREWAQENKTLLWTDAGDTDPLAHLGAYESYFGGPIGGSPDPGEVFQQVTVTLGRIAKS
jgi:hypothetical protein